MEVPQFTVEVGDEAHEEPKEKTTLAMEIICIMLEVRSAIWALFDAQNGEDLGGFGWKEGITPDRPFSYLSFIILEQQLSLVRILLAVWMNSNSNCKVVFIFHLKLFKAISQKLNLYRR
eukprot:snap_masked-scaffold_18-processed-gene-4.15-mRNA-1 protein AED:1.00 eAED:1.00 QI:0/0/0/0/1/1/4/0/118